MPSPRPQSLPVFLLIRTAYQFFWRHRDDSLRLAFVPTLVSFGGLAFNQSLLTSVADQYQAGQAPQLNSGDEFTLMVTAVITLLSMVTLVANWLRFMLLGPMGAVGLGLAIGRPHLAFVVTTVVLSFVGGIGVGVISMPLLFLPPALVKIGTVVAFIVVFVGLARLLPFAVAQAIGQPISLQQAWSASRGNGAPLATALILVQLPLWVIDGLVTNILWAVGFAAVAPLAMFFINTVFMAAAAILHATVLATAFRQMVGIRV